MIAHRSFLTLIFSGLVLGALGFAACSSETNGGNSGPVGGPTSGPADAHCKMAQKTSEAACAPGGAGGAGGGTGAGGEATGAGGGGEDMDEYGETLNNAEGDDDECKYHVKWTASPIRQNEDVTFTVTVTTKSDDKAAAGADPDIEAYLNETHPAPNSSQSAKETSAGVYTVGPVRFDAAGDWTVRFHIHEECVDGEESPHGHVAFFVRVP